LQRPHRENKTQISVKRQQFFFFLQNQLDGFFLTLFAVRSGKVAFVYPANVGSTALQVQAVCRVKLRLAQS